jgi:putative MFS transporter
MDSAAKRAGGAGIAAPQGRDGGAALIARLEAVPFSRWHARARIVMGSATFLDAFDALSLAFVLPILNRLWQLSSVEIGLLIAASYVGQLAGALLFSGLAERYGRVPCAAAAIALMSVMSLGCALAGSFALLFVCRLVQGVGVGGEMPVAAAYISELSRAAGRGRFFLLYEMIFPVGLMATGQIGTLLVPLFGWKIMFLIGGIPGLAVCLLVLRLPESPRWLVSRARLGDAERVVRAAEASTPRRQPAEAAATPQRPRGEGPEASRWAELLSPAFRRRSLIVWALWSCAFLVTNSLNNWMPTLYSSVYGLPLKEALRAASMNNVAQVLVLLVCAFTIDRIGRRNWMAAAFAAGTALLAFLAASGGREVAQVMVLATLSYGVVGSANAVLYLYTPEIYPTRLRAIGTGLATSWLRLASAVGPALVGVIVAEGGIAAVFAMFAAISALGALAALGMIETRRKQLEEIAA